MRIGSFMPPFMPRRLGAGAWGRTGSLATADGAAPAGAIWPVGTRVRFTAMATGVAAADIPALVVHAVQGDTGVIQGLGSWGSYFIRPERGGQIFEARGDSFEVVSET